MAKKQMLDSLCTRGGLVRDKWNSLQTDVAAHCLGYLDLRQQRKVCAVSVHWRRCVERALERSSEIHIDLWQHQGRIPPPFQLHATTVNQCSRVSLVFEPEPEPSVERIRVPSWFWQPFLKMCCTRKVVAVRNLPCDDYRVTEFNEQLLDAMVQSGCALEHLSLAENNELVRTLVSVHLVKSLTRFTRFADTLHQVHIAELLWTVDQATAFVCGLPHLTHVEMFIDLCVDPSEPLDAFLMRLCHACPELRDIHFQVRCLDASDHRQQSQCTEKGVAVVAKLPHLQSFHVNADISTHVSRRSTGWELAYGGASHEWAFVVLPRLFGTVSSIRAADTHRSNCGVDIIRSWSQLPASVTDLSFGCGYRGDSKNLRETVLSKRALRRLQLADQALEVMDDYHIPDELAPDILVLSCPAAGLFYGSEFFKRRLELFRPTACKRRLIVYETVRTVNAYHDWKESQTLQRLFAVDSLRTDMSFVLLEDEKSKRVLAHVHSTRESRKAAWRTHIRHLARNTHAAGYASVWLEACARAGVTGEKPIQVEVTDYINRERFNS